MRRLVAAAAIFTMLEASAAESPLPTWTQEPTSVLGIKIGIPLSESPLPACTRPSAANNWRLPEQVCIEGSDGPYADEIRLLDGLPWNEVRISGSVSLFDGNVAAVGFELNHDDYEKFKAILVTRYGQPSQTSNSTVTSNAGAVASSETLQWVGKNVSILVMERSGRIDRSAVQISSNELMRKSAERRKAAIEAAASKL